MTEKKKSEEEMTENKKGEEEKTEAEKIMERSTMRFKSTGLGDTVLFGDIDDLYGKDGIMYGSLKTTSPVKWHIRVAVNRKALWGIILKCLRFKNIIFILSLLLFRKEKWPEDF